MGALQVIQNLILPPQCLACSETVQSDQALCPACWGGVRFIENPCCEKCGSPLPGEDEGTLLCDDCMYVERPWKTGAAVFEYAGKGRNLVLAFKHADRLDMVPGVSRWLALKLEKMQIEDPIILPVPLHWRRRLKRKYNQAEVLGTALSDRTGYPILANGLMRKHATKPMEHHTIQERKEQLEGVFEVNPAHKSTLTHRNVLILDDVMTTGTTFEECAKALSGKVDCQIHVLALARVCKSA